MDPLTLGIAGAGAMGGLYNAFTGNEEARRQAAQKQAAIDAYGNSAGKRLDAYGNSARNAIDGYGNAMSGIGANYLNNPGGLQAWLNPDMDYQMQQIGKMNNQQYAAGGQMNSGAAMKALQDRAQQQAKLSFADAFNMMNRSNDQAIGLKSGQAANELAAGTGLAGNMFNAGQGIDSNALNAKVGLASPQQQSLANSALGTSGAAVDMYGKIRNAFR